VRRAGPGARQRGQGLVEYALILLLVAIAVVVALTAVGGTIPALFNSVVTALQST
jgi:pilus assembly protein Flp/PilA